MADESRPRIRPEIQHLAVPLADLVPYERNPRRGNVELIKASLDPETGHGQYRPIVVNKGEQTGRPNEILAGNHTFAAARELGWEEIAATFVDVDSETAAKIVVMDNRASDLAKNDVDVLVELLGELEDLSGTGYSEDDVHKLLVGATPSAEEFTSRFEVVVECPDEDAQQEVYDKLTGEGWTCRVLSL